MKKILFITFRLFIIIFLVFLLMGCKGKAQEPKTSINCPKGTEQVKVKKVIDGDTVELERGEKLRYAGINTLELHTESGSPEPFALRAFQKNKELVEGKEVCLRRNLREKDHYGRLLGELYFPNGTSVSSILVKEGLALVCYYEGSGELYQELLPYQREAIKNKVGLFSNLDKAPPGPYYGNRKSKRLHHPLCSKDVHPKRMILFKSLEEGLAEGYCPVRTCNVYFFKE